MELHTLQVFLAVATERSFSRAAEKMFRTQPAISLALQRLELELGEKLIDRTGKVALYEVGAKGEPALRAALAKQGIRPTPLPPKPK